MSGQHAEGLPQLPVQPGLADLVLEDRVGLAQDLEPLARRLAADDPDRQARPRERLAPDEPLGQAELGADRPDLVLEQRAQRLDQLELEVIGQPADVVVGLDRGRAGAAAGLDHVGVQGPLDEELDVVELRGLLLEHPDELGCRSACASPRDRSRPAAGPGTARRHRPRRAGRGSGRGTPRSPGRPRSCASARGRRTRRSSRSPIARWTSSAATLESTPPESPQIARPSPTWARIRSICSSITDAGLHERSQPQTSSRKFVSTCWPYGVWTTSGWNWIP